jgi:divalent metal cation (Fe/Co/Zn/Cd) transporter
MDKRAFIVGLLAAPIALASDVEAAEKVVSTVRWKAPPGVKKIRVRSWNGNDKVIDTHIDVKPGQTFLFEAIRP